VHQVPHALGKLALRQNPMRHEALAQHRLLVGRDVLLRAARPLLEHLTLPPFLPHEAQERA